MQETFLKAAWDAFIDLFEQALGGLQHEVPPFRSWSSVIWRHPIYLIPRFWTQVVSSFFNAA